MDCLSYVYLLSLFVLLVSISLHFLFYKTTKSADGGAPLPPGETGLPFLGESLEFFLAGRKGHPEKFILDRIAKYSSYIFKTHIFGEKAAVFCGPNGNKFLFSNEHKLVQVWWPKHFNKIFPSPNSAAEDALRARNLLHNVLNPESLQKYVGIMDHLANKHFEEKWENNKEIKVFPLTKEFTFVLACKVFLSIEDPNQVARIFERFDDLCNGMFSIPINLPGTRFNKAIKGSNFIRKNILEIIKQRKIDLAEGKASPTQDILSRMLLTSDEDGKFMQELDIANKILGLLVGGHDTASSACTVTVKYLGQLPEIYQKVYNEQMEIAESKAPGELLNWDDLKKMKYSWNVACEALRLAPPLQGSFREALVDFAYNGFSIPKGWKLYWNANSTHMNPKFFPEPKKFDPSRFEGFGPAPYTFVPFGGGSRICPGKEYARLEILVFIHQLVKRFKWENIFPDEKMIIDPLPVPVKGLPIRLYPHNHKA